MTTDEMITALRSYLGNIGNLLDAEMLVELKLAQTELEHGEVMPWFLQTTATGSVSASTLALPSDFLRIVETDGLWLQQASGKWTKLIRRSFEEIYEEYAGSTEGTPEYYDIVGGDIHLYPTPNIAYSYRLSYYAKDTTLALADSGNGWSTHFPTLLLGLAGLNMAMSFKAVDLYQRFEMMVAKGMRLLNTDTTAREVMDLEESFGGG